MGIHRKPQAVITSKHKEKDEDHQIDILFKDVNDLHLISTMNGLEIYANENDDKDDLTIFRILSENFEGHVVAAAMATDASDRDFRDRDAWGSFPL